jgi:phage terminase large subunit-like protein
MTETTEEIDFTSVVRQARAAMSDAAYRKKFCARDFLVLSPLQRSFLNSSATALFAKCGNQVGKSTAGSEMVVSLATQVYAPWYTGWKQPKLNIARGAHSCTIWVLGPSWQMLRDGAMGKILGDVAAGLAGTGLMPAENIVSLQTARNISGAIDSAVCRRLDGTTCVIRFKSYEQGMTMLQSETVDFILCDELPPDMDIFSELLSRLAATSGIIWVTATPRRQQSPISQWFREPGHPERVTIMGGIDDALHLTETQRDEIKARFANNPLEAATRLYGHDFGGGGSCINVPMANYIWDGDPQEFPPYTKYLIGADPSHGGLNPNSAHPSAAVLCAIDPDNLTMYVLDCLRLKTVPLAVFVQSILHWEQGDAPVAWGAAENSGMGEGTTTYAARMKELGLRILPEHAQYIGGGYGLDASIDEVETLMLAGKLKIHRKCVELLEELASWERDDNGKPIPLRDDCISALRYAVMMRRKARVLDETRPGHRGIYRGVPIGQGLRRGRDANKSYTPDGGGDTGTDWGA